MLSGPWVPDSGVNGQALAVTPDGKLLFSGGHWDGSLRVTALPRGKLLNQLSCHLGMSSLGAVGGTGGGSVPRLPREGVITVFYLYLSLCRHSNLPCTGHLWHLPHLRLPRHHVHGVATPAAGVLGGQPREAPIVQICSPPAP